MALPNLPYDAWANDTNSNNLWSNPDNWRQAENVPGTPPDPSNPHHVIPQSNEIVLLNPAFPQSNNPSSTPFTIVYDSTVPSADRTIGGLWVDEPKVKTGTFKGDPSETLQIGASGASVPADAVTLTVLGNVSYTYPTGSKKTISGNRNSDVIEVTANGTLVLEGALVNSGGLLNVLSGGVIDFTGANVTKGSMTIAAGGTVNATGSGKTTMITGVATTDNGVLGATGGATLDLCSVVTGTGQIVANGGTVLLDNATLAALSLSSLNSGIIETKAGTVESLIKTGASIAANTTLTVVAGSSLTVEGKLANNGEIAIQDPVASGGTLLINGNLSLSGTGSIVLGGAPADILDNGAAATLTNMTNTITGSGSIGNGDGNLSLVNSANGTVDANGGAIAIDAAVANHGSLQAENGGSLTLDGALSNAGGTINANGGTITATNTSATPLGGEIKIGAGGTFDLAAGPANAAVAFSATTGSTGTLELGSSGNYSGLSVGNLKGDNNQGNVIDLRSVIFADLSTDSFTPGTGTPASGVLSVSDGTHMNSVTLLGQYVANFTESAPAANYSGFVLSADAGGGTLVSYIHAVAPPPAS